MFLPGRDSQQERVEKQKVVKKVENWAEELIPEPIRKDCQVSIQEVLCGDPNCSPVDTLVTLLFSR